MDRHIYDKDRRVRVYLDNTAVVNSALQSQYAKFLNFKNRFTATVNPDGTKYDIDFKYADQVLTKLNGTQVGTQPRYLNFSSDFTDVETIATNTYDIGLKNPYKVLAQNAGAAVNTTPRKVNFIGFKSVAENVSNDTVDITAPPAGGFSNFDTNTGRKYGSLLGGGGWTSTSYPGALLGDGFMTGWRAVGRFDSNHESSNLSDANGSCYVITTGSSSGNNAYYASSETNSGSGTTAPFNLGVNPNITASIMLPSNSSIRIYLGFFDTYNSSSVLTNSSDVLGGIYGFGIRYDSSPDTNFTMINNSGSTSSVTTDTGVQALANTMYTIQVWGDNANSRFGCSINNGTPIYATSHIPTGNYGFGYTCFIQGTSKLMYVYYIRGQIDK